MLQDCFDHADWDIFRVDVYTDSVTGFIRKCIQDVVPTEMITIYPSQKPWIDGSIQTKLERASTTFNHIEL
jgi:hypothetical protein